MPEGGLSTAIVNASILAMFIVALALLIYAKKPWRVITVNSEKSRVAITSDEDPRRNH